MRTEHDLRATMDDLAAAAPTGADVLSRFHSSPRRTRTRVVVPALAVAATIMVIAASASVLHARQGERSAAPADVTASPSVSYPCAVGAHLDVTGITMRPVSGLASTTRSQTGCSGHSSRELDNIRGLDVGSVFVYRAGVFDTRLVEHARKVSGSGVTAYVLRINPADPRFAHMVDPQNGPTGSTSANRCPVAPGTTRQTPKEVATSDQSTVQTTCPAPVVLAWPYASNRWAVIVGSSLDYASSFYGHDRTAKLLEIAAATDTAHPTPITVPFQNHSLPSDIRVVAVSSYTTGGGRVVASTVGFGVIGRAGCPAGLVCDQIGEVSLTPRVSKPTMSGTPVVVDGRTGYLIDQGENRPDIVLDLWTGTWFVTVRESSDRQVPDRTIVHIANTLRYATSVSDRSTWFNINVAFDN